MSTSLHPAPPRVAQSVWPRSAATLTVDHAAVAENLRILRESAGVDVMAVVKADGFGLGAIELSRTLAANGASALGVTTVDEAIVLRRAGLTLPVLAWLGHPGADIATALRLRVELSCASEEMLVAVAATAAVLGLVARIHLEVDTGMHRGGAAPLHWEDLCRSAARLERAGSLRVAGIWSHLARAGHPHWSAVADQEEAFRLALGSALASGLQPIAHLASSAAALAHPRTRHDLVRCGAALYGIEPVEGRNYGLRPVVRVAARILQLRAVGAGSSVGYGAGHITREATTLALLPLGYADGVPRSLAGTGQVSIAGMRCPIVGAVSMDQLVVDVGQLELQPGDEAVLIGDPEAGEPSLADIARLAGTIPQEVLGNLGARFERIHLGAQRVA